MKEVNALKMITEKLRKPCDEMKNEKPQTATMRLFLWFMINSCPLITPPVSQRIINNLEIIYSIQDFLSFTTNG